LIQKGESAMNTRPVTARNAGHPRPRLARLSAALLLASACSLAQAGKLGVFTSDNKGFDTHTFYYDDGREVVIIDTQFVPALTQKMVEQIRQDTQSPITRVIVTHPNPDKFNGLAWLHAQGVHSISSRAVADAIPAVHAYKTHFWVDTMKAFKAEDYPRLENVQETFDGASKALQLKSGETLTLFALKNPGVANQQVVVRVDATGDLIVGDLVHHNAHAWLEGGLQGGRPAPSLQGWRAALDELPALSAGHPKARVYGGRGDFALVKDAVRAQQRYLQGVERVTRSYLADAARCRAEIDSPQKADEQHAALEQRISAEFPGYKLPYMVRYSVFGLAGEVARQTCARP
jgi:glyoxylase-like metal-dependent hydrolase (beta-lactamase superfamily II)